MGFVSQTKTNGRGKTSGPSFLSAHVVEMGYLCNRGGIAAYSLPKLLSSKRKLSVKEIIESTPEIAHKEMAWYKEKNRSLRGASKQRDKEVVFRTEPIEDFQKGENPARQQDINAWRKNIYDSIERKGGVEAAEKRAYEQWLKKPASERRELEECLKKNRKER